MIGVASLTTRLVWGGHGTVRLETAGVGLLVDPLLRPRVQHLRRRGPVPAGLTDGLDAVLITHMHHDHLDLPSLRRIDPEVPVIAPRGAGPVLAGAGRRRVREVGPGDSVAVGPAVVWAVEADHDGTRSPGRARGPALGFVVEGAHRAYVAGDTAPFAGMAALAPLDVALLPVAGWSPHLGPGHMDPAQAAGALTLLRPRVAVPIHWGTVFPVWLPPGRRGFLDAPGPEFRRVAAEVAPQVRVVVLRPGEALELPAAGA